MKMNSLLRRLLDEVPSDGTATGGAAEPAADSAVDWEGMSDFQDQGSDDVEGGEDEVPVPDADETAGVEEEVSEVPDEATPEEVVEELPALTPEQLAQREKEASEWVAQREEKLIQYYGLDEESAAQMVTEPEVVLPKLAARLHMQIETAVRQQVQTLLETQMPGIIRQTQVRDTENQKAKDAFYTAWPELKGYEEQVLHVGSMFRQMNPKADQKTAIESIGKTALSLLGLTRAQQQEQKQAPVAGARPFRPATSGAAAPAPTGNKSSKWDELTDE